MKKKEFPKHPEFCREQVEFLNMDAWRVMRVMGEFVESFDYMTRIPEMLVSVFGSARVKEGSPMYESARDTVVWTGFFPWSCQVHTSPRWHVASHK